MYVYKKSDKKQEHPIYLSNGVRYKLLWNKALKFEQDIRDYTIMNLMFEGEEESTKQELYKAIDCLRRFRHNLKLKDNIQVE